MREIMDMSVLITGGGSGIGEATARLFAARGAKVTITGRRQDKIDAVAQSIGKACRAVAGDVTVHKDREAMLAAAVEHGGKLDALISNAANMYRQAVGEYTEDFLKEAFNTNVISGMMLSSMAVPLLEASRGAIIFLGSIHNRRAYPGASPYATTKAAVEGLSRVMAAELGRKQIRVSCILPGAVSTEINLRAGLFTAQQAQDRYAAIAPDHALARIGTVTEIAEAVEYLVCAEWVTGVALEVDGGLGLGVSNF
jgi:3-oxoacyl-[acyl-carrier protein] reductase